MDSAIDWPERWRHMVEARADQVTRYRDADAGDAYWERRARAYGKSHRPVRADDPVVELIAGISAVSDTILDVGAGTGRYALALASTGRTVIAVEPSSAMSGILVDSAAAMNLGNLSVIHDRWQNVPSIVADVVLCAHVLYPIPDVVPFVRALQAAARGSCVLVLRACSPDSLLRDAWLAIHGEEPRYDPAFIETYNLLWSIGIAANVTFVPRAANWSFPDMEAAIAWAREVLWAPPSTSNAALWSHLEPHFMTAPGGFTFREPTPPTAMVWWHTA